MPVFGVGGTNEPLSTSNAEVRDTGAAGSHPRTSTADARSPGGSLGGLLGQLRLPRGKSAGLRDAYTSAFTASAQAMSKMKASTVRGFHALNCASDAGDESARPPRLRGRVPTERLHFAHVSEMQPVYRGEQIRKPGSVPVKYLTEAELRQYRVTGGKKGEALDGSGKPLDTTKGGTANKAIGTLDMSGRIYIAHRAPENADHLIKHSSFVNGGRAAAAFEIRSVDGKKLELWPNSGHYLTTPEQMEQLRDAFRAHGITAEIEIHGFEPDERLTIF